LTITRPPPHHDGCQTIQDTEATITEHETLLVTLVSQIPVPPPPATRGRGRPRTYPDRLFLQALVIMIVRHLHTVHGLLRVLAQPTAEMHTWRDLLTVEGRFPARRPWGSCPSSLRIIITDRSEAVCLA
jgi:hypothetical protein